LKPSRAAWLKPVARLTALSLAARPAEMPGMYSGDDYDLAGFIVGVVEKERLTLGNSIVAETLSWSTFQRSAYQRFFAGPQDFRRDQAGPERGVSEIGRPWEKFYSNRTAATLTC